MMSMLSRPNISRVWCSWGRFRGHVDRKLLSERAVRHSFFLRASTDRRINVLRHWR